MKIFLTTQVFFLSTFIFLHVKKNQTFLLSSFDGGEVWIGKIENIFVGVRKEGGLEGKGKSITRSLSHSKFI